MSTLSDRFPEILDQMNSPPPAAPGAPSLTAALRADGFLPGVPYTVRPATVRADAKSARAASCPACTWSGMTLNPFFRDTDYRAVARCDRCKHEVEL